ncbi:MAG: glutathione peroxidase [Paludibacteraceae bacterium]|nr:glutathione peroxidase [Paludibacteraceae bacterium]
MKLYDIKVTKRENRNNIEVSLSEYEGKVLLIVNTATGCGLTPQYEALEKLYRKYKEHGFEILDFPCNQFMEQAKGSDEEIGSFCSAKYDTTFPRFKKIDVNGPDESPLYTFLKSAIGKGESKNNFIMSMMIAISSKINGKSGGKSDIKWNFEKFLIDRNGNVVRRFAPTVTPEQIEDEIRDLLKQ